jgi:hypothetical protein
MNRKTLTKVIDELKKDAPKLDYVLGILETLLESLPEEPKGLAPFLPNTSTAIASPVSEPIKDEVASMEASSIAMLKNIDMSQISKE